MIRIRHSTFDIRHWAVLGFVFLLGPLGSLTHAAALSWDPTATGGPNGGGIGTWDTGSWWNGTAGTAGDVSWSDGNNAVFGGTLGGGGVTILNGVAPNNVYFNIGGYSITGNMLTLGNGTIGVATGSDTIGSPIAGSSGLTKSGAGRARSDRSRLLQRHDHHQRRHAADQRRGQHALYLGRPGFSPGRCGQRPGQALLSPTVKAPSTPDTTAPAA